MSPVATEMPRIPAGEQCVLCRCRLTTPYLIERGLCGSCSERPEARRLPRDEVGRPLPRAADPPRAPKTVDVPRAFSPAERSLIDKLHAVVPIGELLKILNDRRRVDSPSAVLVVLEQLHAELQAVAQPAAAAAVDWAGLRKLLGEARTNGVLGLITMTTIDDYAVVYQLSPAQVLRLKDVIQHAKEVARGEGIV